MLDVIDIKNLTVRYGTTGIVALDNINLAVKQGDFIGVMGPNGAGKSTLFSCMLGLHQQYTGTIKFFDTDIRKSRDYLKHLGYVPQKPVFEANFPATVRDVVLMGLQSSGNKNKQQNKNDKVDAILQQLWIHELSHRRIGELSGGQQQRVFIAKALISEPTILILDEPVTGVDLASTEIFYSILQDINKKQKITIIWSSHDMDAINRLVNKIACLDKTVFFHGYSSDFFNNEELVKKYSEASMQKHMHDHHLQQQESNGQNVS